MMQLRYLIFSLIALIVDAEKARFDNYRVYSIAVDNQQQLNVLKELNEISDSVKFS